MPNIDLKPHDWAEVKRILTMYVPEYDVWVFGSRATWTAKAYSDLDLAVITDKKLPLSAMADLKTAFDQSDLSIKVDVVDWASTSQSFRDIIRKTSLEVLKGSAKTDRGKGNGWSVATIAEISEKVGMGPFGSSIKVETFVPSGIPVISGQHLRGCRLQDTDYNFISLEHADKLASANVKRGDVIFTHAGNIGQVAYIPETSRYERYVISQRQFYMRPNRKKVLPEFVALFFSSAEGQHKLLANTSSSGVPSIAQPVTYLRTIEVPLPPLPEQRAIAHILGTLDDKIELNRRMNETLENIARTLFKSWFVDFDPVRAKAEGRDTGLPKHLTDLFPDSFEDSELGEIPKGWEIKPIGYLADVMGGGTPSTKEPRYWEGGTHHWATPKDLSGLSVPVLLDTDRRITDTGLAQVSSGLLPKGTVLLSSRAPIGYLVVTEIPVAINQGFIAMNAKKGVSNFFLLLWASVAHEEIISRANGSTFLEISKTNFRPIPVITPSDDVMQKFEQLTRPLYKRIVECAREARTLAALRDTLLPKLISGELRMPERMMKAEAHA